MQFVNHGHSLAETSNAYICDRSARQHNPGDVLDIDLCPCDGHISGRVRFGVLKVMITFVPAGPRTLLTTSLKLIPVMSTPSTLSIISPAFTPAACAGDPSMGATITT